MYWLAFALVMVISGLVQGLLGFGYAIVALAVLPYWMDVRLANLAVSFSVLIPLWWLSWQYRHDADWHAIRDCLIGSLLGLPIGLLAFIHVDAHWLIRGTGIIILWISVAELCRANGHSSGRKWSRTRGASAGFASGFLAGAVGIPGPPLVLYVATLSWDPKRFKGFVLAFFSILAALKLFAVTGVGLLDAEVLWHCSIGIPGVWIGQVIGMALYRRVAAAAFRRMTLTLLALAALGMVLRTAEF